MNNIIDKIKELLGLDSRDEYAKILDRSIAVSFRNADIANPYVRNYLRKEVSHIINEELKVNGNDGGQDTQDKESQHPIVVLEDVKSQLSLEGKTIDFEGDFQDCVTYVAKYIVPEGSNCDSYIDGLMKSTNDKPTKVLNDAVVEHINSFAQESVQSLRKELNATREKLILSAFKNLKYKNIDW